MNKYCIDQEEIYRGKRKLKKLKVKVSSFWFVMREKKNWDYLICDVKDVKYGR